MPNNNNKKRNVPKTAAVILTCPRGQYDLAMKETRSKIDLTQCGVEKGKGSREPLLMSLHLNLRDRKVIHRRMKLRVNLRSYSATERALELVGLLKWPK